MVTWFLILKKDMRLGIFYKILDYNNELLEEKEIYLNKEIKYKNNLI